MTKRSYLRNLRKFYNDNSTSGVSNNAPIIPTSTPLPKSISDDQIVKAFSDLTGYNPTTGANNKGVAVLDALNYWRKTGVAGHQIYAFTTVDWKNKANVKAAIYIFGGIYAGIQLPVSAMTQDIWDVPAQGPVGTGLPNSWGGHLIPIIAYDDNYLYCVTFGAIKQLTWNFLTTYCDEAYVIITQEFAGTKAVQGFDMTTLQNDLTNIANLSQLYPPAASG